MKILILFLSFCLLGCTQTDIDTTIAKERKVLFKKCIDLIPDEDFNTVKISECSRISNTLLR